MNPTAKTSPNWALILIAVALVGAGVSYHFTLESRFATIEQKLDQNSVALQQYQISQETIYSSKNDALTNLSKEVDTLQASLEPLGKSTREQTDSLSDIRKQIVSLQQSQQNEQDAQKKLSDYAGQLEKMKHDIQAQSGPVPAPAVSIPVSAPGPAPVAQPAFPPHTSASITHLLVQPLVESAVDIRPDAETTVATDVSVRALPVAMPVADIR